MEFNSTEELIKDIKSGKMVILLMMKIGRMKGSSMCC